MFAYTLKIAKQKRKLPINDMMMCAYLLVLFKVTKISLCRKFVSRELFSKSRSRPFLDPSSCPKTKIQGKCQVLFLKKKKKNESCGRYFMWMVTP